MTYQGYALPGLPRPFSGPRYATNAARCGAQEPCALCGKPITSRDTAVFVSVGDGGSVFLSPAEEAAAKQDAGFMGCFPLGPECWRKHRQAFQQLGYTAPTRRTKA